MSEVLRSDLLLWFRENQRDLPWRIASENPEFVRDPYKVWVSEIMLQQTQVKTVVPYFERWMDQFPTVEKLAQADREDVLKAWEGLGYYRRARRLHMAAEEMVSNRTPIFPTTFAGWKSVSGVGDYTAAAIASIAFAEPVAAIDGNVTRVVSRLFAEYCNVDKAEGKRKIRAHAAGLVDPKNPGGSNEALMELGATVCKPKTPRCGICPIEEYCLGSADAELLPVKNPRRKAKKWSPWVLVPTENSRIGLRRGEEELLGGLWGFEVFETAESLKENWPFALSIGTVRHLFTHRDTTFNVATTQVTDPSYTWVDPRGAHLPAMSTAMRKVMALYVETSGETNDKT